MIYDYINNIIECKIRYYFLITNIILSKNVIFLRLILQKILIPSIIVLILGKICLYIFFFAILRVKMQMIDFHNTINVMIIQKNTEIITSNHSIRKNIHTGILFWLIMFKKKYINSHNTTFFLSCTCIFVSQ